MELRSCLGFEELDACVALQVETWGYADGDVIPRRSFTVAQAIGGQVIGAFDLSLTGKAEAKSLAGFAMAMPGVHPDASGEPEAYLHSHMLAVRAAYRNDGMGRRLKLFQRKEALSRGIRNMEWTFDPLEIKNAFLNIHRLGAIVRRYIPNFYGVSSSRLQAGLPSDRLVAEWYLDSPRVIATLGGVNLPTNDAAETIVVPRAIGEWKSAADSLDRAQKVQEENRGRFLDAFSRGLAVVGFERSENGDGIFRLDPFPQAQDAGKSGEARPL
ncbi:GNAT family N-acetyltransferase [Silvibacterium dinghuense]|uniref:GNAT family N-acetyltransferase n=1 Tax=Silvibacterium dinghuense TaxID=1560006 RepID=A0A4Q1SK41_9BACT|nr:GNAT family N-acetyltransferase [Silvibacterium dinghuense]